MTDDTRIITEIVAGGIAARWIAAALQLVLFKAFLEPLAAWAGRSPISGWIDYCTTAYLI
jgi:hypothetical protein